MLWCGNCCLQGNAIICMGLKQLPGKNAATSSFYSWWDFKEASMPYQILRCIDIFSVVMYRKYGSVNSVKKWALWEVKVLYMNQDELHQAKCRQHPVCWVWLQAGDRQWHLSRRRCMHRTVHECSSPTGFELRETGWESFYNRITISNIQRSCIIVCTW